MLRRSRCALIFLRTHQPLEYSCTVGTYKLLAPKNQMYWYLRKTRIWFVSLHSVLTFFFRERTDQKAFFVGERTDRKVRTDGGQLEPRTTYSTHSLGYRISNRVLGAGCMGAKTDRRNVKYLLVCIYTCADNLVCKFCKFMKFIKLNPTAQSCSVLFIVS